MTLAPDARAACDDDLAWNAETEHGHHIADAELRIVDAVQRDRADVREDADARVGAVGQPAVAGIVSRRRCVGCGGPRCRRRAARA